MIPWIVPGMTRMEISLLACTGPKAFEMPRSSMAGAAVSGRPVFVWSITLGSEGERGAAVVAAVVVHRDLACDDRRFGFLDRRLHLVGDEFGVVLVERPAHA